MFTFTRPMSSVLYVRIVHALTSLNNPKIADELMVIYFDVNKEIFSITHES